jgi:hypothetical protein
MSPLAADPVATEPEEDVGPLPSAAQVTPPALTYDLEPGRPQVTRRQFRFLLILTLVNTLMLGAFVAGPGISKMTAGWWNNYKRWRDDRAKARQDKAIRDKFLVDYRRILTHSAPPDKVAYEEDQDRAAKLLAAGDHTTFFGGNPVYLTPKPWQTPVMPHAPLPLQLMSIRSGVPGAPLFIGGRKTPSGEERFVWVGLISDQRWETVRDRSDAVATSRRYNVKTRRILSARAYRPHAVDTVLEGGGQHTLEILQPPDGETTVTWTMTTSWENGRIDVLPRHLMRFFMGQPDPNDSSRFTITYEINGERGILDGQLHDDQTVTLRPRQGRIVRSDQLGRSREWDPHAEPAPK